MPTMASPVIVLAPPIVVVSAMSALSVVLAIPVWMSVPAPASPPSLISFWTPCTPSPVLPPLSLRMTTTESSNIPSITSQNLFISIVLLDGPTDEISETHTFPSFLFPFGGLFQRFLHLLLPRQLTVSQTWLHWKPQRLAKRILFGFFDTTDLFCTGGGGFAGGLGPVAFGVPREVFVLLPATDGCGLGRLVWRRQ